MGGQIALVLIVFVHYKGSGSKESLASFYHVLFVAHALSLLATRSLRSFAQLRTASSRRAAPHRILTVYTVTGTGKKNQNKTAAGRKAGRVFWADSRRALRQIREILGDSAARPCTPPRLANLTRSCPLPSWAMRVRALPGEEEEERAFFTDGEEDAGSGSRAKLKQR